VSKVLDLIQQNENKEEIDLKWIREGLPDIPYPMINEASKNQIFFYSEQMSLTIEESLQKLLVENLVIIILSLFSTIYLARYVSLLIFLKSLIVHEMQEK
jgi:hypothetical protein